MQMPQIIQKIEKRPFDRFVLGPFLIWYGLRSKTMNKWPRRIIVSAGIYQVIYALEDYRKVANAVQKGPGPFLDIVAKNTIYHKDFK